MTEPLPSPPATVTGLRRLVYIVLGWVFVGLAVLGFLVPGLPRTPFLLLASYYFARSSPRLNAWLLRSRLFGPILRDWQERRGVRRRVKVVAIAIIPIAIFFSVYFAQLSWPLVTVIVVLALIGIVVIILLPEVKEGEKKVEHSQELSELNPAAREPPRS